MLLPVTIVPRTVGAVGAIVTTGSTAAVNGIAMLNPARWGAAVSTSSSGYGAAPARFDDDDDMKRSVLFHSTEEEDAEPGSSLGNSAFLTVTPTPNLCSLFQT